MKSCLPFCKLAGNHHYVRLSKLKKQATRVNCDRLEQKPLQATHNVASENRSQVRVGNQTSTTDSCNTFLSRKIKKKLSTPTDDVLCHFIWCVRNYENHCLKGNMYWTNLQTQTHTYTHKNKSKTKIQSQHNANYTPEEPPSHDETETQTSDAGARVCRSAA